MTRWMTQTKTVLAKYLTTEDTVSFLLSSIKHYFNNFFKLFTCLISRMSQFKFFGFVQWQQREPNLLSSLNYYNYYCDYVYYLYFTYMFMEIQKVDRRLRMLRALKFFLVISESPLRFPSLVPSLRVLDSFLLQTWCVKMSTF
jgi:hypothetical protein